MVEDYVQTLFILKPLQTCGVDASLIGVFAVFTVGSCRIVSDREPVLAVSCVPATLTATATATQLQLEQGVAHH